MAFGNHWHEHARQWSWVGPPLRPCRADVELVERWLGDWAQAAGNRAISGLLLGVTPELAGMRWPVGTRLLAVDCNLSMIAGVWPGNRLTLPALAVAGDWQCLPLASGSMDLVVGDGCFTLLRSPEGFNALYREVARILKPGGRFLIRHFTRLEPSGRETLDNIWSDFSNGRIGNFHVLKWRLAMALHGTLEEGVRLGDVWQAWHAWQPEAREIALGLGWPEPVLRTIDNYRDRDTRYTFATLSEIRAGLSPLFREEACHIADYELGERCPSLWLASNQGP